MKSKVISRANRGKLANILTVFACKDEFKPILDKYNEACDLLTPIHDKVLDDIEALPDLAKRFVRVEVDNDKDIDVSKPAYDLKAVFQKVDPFYDNGRYGQMAFGDADVIEVCSHTKFNWDVQVAGQEWDASLFPKKMHIRNIANNMDEVRIKSNRYLVTTGYMRNVLPEDYMPLMQPAMVAYAWAEQMKFNLRDSMRAMCHDLEENIETAKTTKNLVAAWPEAEPFIAKLYPECTDSGVQSTCESPLGNIILRHIKQLPAPAQAAE